MVAILHTVIRGANRYGGGRDLSTGFKDTAGEGNLGLGTHKHKQAQALLM